MLLYHNKLFEVQLDGGSCHYVIPKKKRFVNRTKKDGKFLSLVKQQRRMFFSHLIQAWDKEKILSPYKELNLRPSDPAL